MSATPTVLIVDDDPAMLRLLDKWLSGSGYRVGLAKSVTEAKAAILKDCPTILITDWEMPQASGVDLCQWVRTEELPHYVYTLFLSVRSGSQDMIRGLEAGADDFIKKPVDKAELLARLRTAHRVLEVETRLNQLSNVDPLTKLHTKKSFFESFQKEWSRSVRHNIALSCVMIDIDYFKRINDTHGHPTGDEVLRCLGKLLRSSCRDCDVVSRYGGEEFCALLPETSEDEAVLWADRLRQLVAALEIPTSRETLRITASFGVAQRTAAAKDEEELVDQADQALLIAKQSGRDRVVGFRSLAEGDGSDAPLDAAAEVFRDVSAGDVMTNVVASLRAESTAGEAAEYFLRFGVHSAPIVDSKGQLVGMLSDRDVMAIMLWPDWWNTPIESVMKKNVVAYQEATPAMAIYEFLCRVSLRAVVIVRDQLPVGVISRGNLLRWFTNAVLARRNSKQHQIGLPRDEALFVAGSLLEQAQHMHNLLKSEERTISPAIIGGASHCQDDLKKLLSLAPLIDGADKKAKSVADGQTVVGLSALLGSQ